MKTSAGIACMLLCSVSCVTAQDSIRVISMDVLLQSEDRIDNTASMLTASKDPVAGALAFSFAAVRYRQRGYSMDMSGTYMNGLPLQNLENGAPLQSAFSGLNDIMRNKTVTRGLWHNDFAFGEPGSNTDWDTRAGKQRKQTVYSYAFSDRQYTHRLSLMHSTGFNSRGWAMAIAATRRWAGETYVQGTFYNSNSYYIAVEKKAGAGHSVSFMLAGAYTRYGMQAAALLQTIKLTDNQWYNAYWGYQQGRKRNSNVSTTHQPQLIIAHEWHTSSGKIIWKTTAGYTGGYRGITGMDWYNAADPRPDYYRYLPDYSGNAAQKDLLAQEWESNTTINQLNWDRFYQVNQSNYVAVADANGVAGGTVQGNRSLYILQEKMSQLHQLAVATSFFCKPSQYISLTSGISYRHQQTHYFKRVNDLLGGDWFVDVNQFAEEDDPANVTAAQNDIRYPNHLVRKGDTYGYDYSISISKTEAFLQALFRLHRIDGYIAGNVSELMYFRNGYMQNGLFPDNSLGRSAVSSYTGYAGKAGMMYKWNGRHYTYVQTAYYVRPPFAANTFISPRTQQTQVNNAGTETVQTAEAGYVLNAPRLAVRAVAFVTQSKGAAKVLSFYHDEYRSFVNYALSGIAKWYGGAELGVEAKLTADLTLNMVAATGRYYYSSRQQAEVTADNSTGIIEKTTIFIKNYRIGTGPQEVYNAALMYRSPDNWFCSAAVNFSSHQWLEVNPLRLTVQATDNVSSASDQFKNIIQQQQWPAQYTINLFAGYTCKLSPAVHKNTAITFYAGISNLLNNTHIISGGYEQLRFDFDTKNPATFPPKVWYSNGISYMLSAVIRCQ